MTAMSSGGRPSGIPNPLSSASERPHADQSRHRDESRACDESRVRDDARPRPLDQIFPMHGDANRPGEMQSAWRSFCRDRLEAVRGVLSLGRSPPEIAYQLGELLHNHFRTRGATLTSFELRRLVAELLALHGPVENGPEAAAPTAPVPATVEAEPDPEPEKPQPVVAFEGEPPKSPWPGDEPALAATPSPTVPDAALEAPASA